MSRVLVLDTNKKPLFPCRPARARWMLNQRKAAVWRRFPFTIILKQAKPEAIVPELVMKIDPGAKTTGMAVVNQHDGEVVFAAEVTHRGYQVKEKLDARRAQRRGRRSRHTRYRPARFLNRTRPKGWLPPSLMTRVLNIQTWVNRIRTWCPVASLSQELVRFDMQIIQNPEINGVEYQQGELAGYEVREYLLEKWKRTCAYCGKTGIPLQIEHIVPRAKGGSNRVSNLTIACEKCNQKKGTQDITVLLQNKPEVLKKMLVQAKAPLKDAAAVNATRWALYERLKETGLPVEVGSGGLTKWNRTRRGLPKAHWLDAACVGRSTPEQLFWQHVTPLRIEATGRHSRQMCSVDKRGFPKSKAKETSVVGGYRSRDIVRAVVPEPYTAAGVHICRIAIRATGNCKLYTKHGIKSALYRFFQPIHRGDGYEYSYTK